MLNLMSLCVAGLTRASRSGTRALSEPVDPRTAGSRGPGGPSRLRPRRLRRRRKLPFSKRSKRDSQPPANVQ